MSSLYHPYVIAIANQKGGVAKTTSVVSLGGALINKHKEVLLIDLDAQANLTLALGQDPDRVRGVISQVFFNAASLNSVSRDTSIPGLHLVPSNADMDTAERFLPLRKNHEVILRRAIRGSLDTVSAATQSSDTLQQTQVSEQTFSSDDVSLTQNSSPQTTLPANEIQPFAADLQPVEAQGEAGNALLPSNQESAFLPYDFILLDCPPFIGAVTLNAIIAADMLLIPTQPEFFSAHALRTMMLTIKQVRSQLNPTLVYRILITMLDRRNRIHRQVDEQIRQAFGNGVFNSMIEIDTKLRESAVEGLPVTHHPAASRAHPPRSVLQYETLAQELIDYVESR